MSSFLQTHSALSLLQSAVYLEELYYNEAVYDYLVAVQGKVHCELLGTLEHLETFKYTLKSTGKAYWGKARTENDVSGLTYALTLMMTNRSYGRRAVPLTLRVRFHDGRRYERGADS